MIVLLNRVHGLAGLIAGLGLLFLMFGVIADITSRLLLGSALHGIVEYSEIVLVVCTFVSLGFAQHKEMHVAVDTFVLMMPPRMARVVNWLVTLLVVPLLLWLSWRTALLAVESFNRGEYRFGLMQVELWPARAMLPVGLFLWAAEILRSAIAFDQDFRANVDTGSES